MYIKLQIARKFFLVLNRKKYIKLQITSKMVQDMKLYQKFFRIFYLGNPLQCNNCFVIL